MALASARANYDESVLRMLQARCEGDESRLAIPWSATQSCEGRASDVKGWGLRLGREG